jgi:hypothetical protein
MPHTNDTPSGCPPVLSKKKVVRILGLLCERASADLVITVNFIPKVNWTFEKFRKGASKVTHLDIWEGSFTFVWEDEALNHRNNSIHSKWFTGIVGTGFDVDCGLCNGLSVGEEGVHIQRTDCLLHTWVIPHLSLDIFIFFKVDN